MFFHRKVAESSGFLCSVIFLGWWLSFEPNFQAQFALEVPQRAFRPSFSDPSHSRDRRFDLAGSAFDFDRLSAADRRRSFASVRKLQLAWERCQSDIHSKMFAPLVCVFVCACPRFVDVFSSKNRRVVLFLLLSDFPWVVAFF